MAATPPVVQTSTRFIDAAHLTLQPLLLNAISVFALAYIIRCLGPTAFGQWAVATTINAAVMFLVSMGLRPLFVRAVTEQPHRAAELLAQQLGLRTALGALAGGLAVVVAVALGYSGVIVAATALAAVSTLLIAVWTTFADFLQAFHRVRVAATVGTIAGLVVTAVSVTVAWAGGGAVALAASYIIGPLITAIGLGSVIRNRLDCPVRLHWHPSEAKRLLTDSRPLALQLCLNSVRDRGEQLLVPRFLGIEAFGFFAAGMMPVDRLETIPDSLNTSYFTSIARSYGADGARDRALHEVRQLVVTSFAVCLAAAFAMSAFAPLIAGILFPGGGATTAFVMTVTVWALPLTALSGSMTSVLQATGHHQRAARAGIISTLVGSGTSLSLIAMIGLPGAAWGVLVRQAIGVVVLAVPFSKTINPLPRLLPLGRLAVAAAATAAVLWLVSAYLERTTAGLIAGNVFGLVLYSALLFLLRILPWPLGQMWSAWRQSLRSAT